MKTSDKIQHPFMMKAPQKSGIEETFLRILSLYMGQVAIFSFDYYLYSLPIYLLNKGTLFTC